MIKVSDILGKPLISLVDAQNPGFIVNVWFNDKLTQALTAEIVNDESDDGERVFAPLRYTQCEGDAAVIKSSALIVPENMKSAVIPCPINRKCFNQSGKDLGRISDVTLSGNRVTEIICDNASFAPDKLLSAGDDIYIFNDTDKPIKLIKRKTKKQVRETDTALQSPNAQLSAMPTESQPEPQPQKRSLAPIVQTNQVQTPTAPQSVTVTRTPMDRVKDYAFLIGKQVHSPILSRGKIIIDEGSTVDADIIELARIENKLIQLALRAY